MTQGSTTDVAKIVAAAGGELVGRTRLQKTCCLLDMAGLIEGFDFTYHLHGPYSETLSVAASDAVALGLVEEFSKTASWGGVYSVYRVQSDSDEALPEGFAKIVRASAEVDSVVLELAVTAAFLSKNDHANPWEEVARRKAAKVSPDRVAGAKKLLAQLAEIEVPTPIPANFN